MAEKTAQKKKYSYKGLEITLTDQLDVDHTFSINAENFAALQANFNTAGVNFLALLLNFAEEKKKIIMN